MYPKVAGYRLQGTGSDATTYDLQPSTLNLLQDNPPVSSQVFERLASFLTPPRSVPGYRSQVTGTEGSTSNLVAHKPEDHIRWAYQTCAQVIKRHSRSFYFSAR